MLNYKKNGTSLNIYLWSCLCSRICTKLNLIDYFFISISFLFHSASVWIILLCPQTRQSFSLVSQLQKRRFSLWNLFTRFLLSSIVIATSSLTARRNSEVSLRKLFKGKFKAKIKKKISLSLFLHEICVNCSAILFFLDFVRISFCCMDFETKSTTNVPISQ